MEALSDAQLHRQVGHRPAGVAADEVGQLLQDLHLQDVDGALVEGRQQGGILLEGHQGLGLRLQLEESAEPGRRRETEMSQGPPAHPPQESEALGPRKQDTACLPGCTDPLQPDSQPRSTHPYMELGLAFYLKIFPSLFF